MAGAPSREPLRHPLVADAVRTRRRYLDFAALRPNRAVLCSKSSFFIPRNFADFDRSNPNRESVRSRYPAPSHRAKTRAAAPAGSTCRRPPSRFPAALPQAPPGDGTHRLQKRSGILNNRSKLAYVLMPEPADKCFQAVDVDDQVRSKLPHEYRNVLRALPEGQNFQGFKFQNLA